MNIHKIILSLIILTACREKKPDFQLSDNWTRLNIENEEYVIIEPCDAMNNKIQLLQEKTELFITWGHEEETFKILNIEKTNTGYDILIQHYDNEIVKFRIENYDPEKRITKWTWTFGDNNDHEFLMTDKEGLKNIKTISQPCKECWTDEECDEVQKRKLKKN
jgi:hypothetical protein